LSRSSSRYPIPQHSGPELTRDRHFFAYSDNYLIDVKFGVIVDVEVPKSGRSTVSLREMAKEQTSAAAQRRPSHRIFESQSARTDPYVMKAAQCSQFRAVELSEHEH
jgi:hypothetical protein